MRSEVHSSVCSPEGINSEEHLVTYLLSVKQSNVD